MWAAMRTSMSIAIDPTLAADPKTGVPPTGAPLTDLKGVRTLIFAVAQVESRNILYIGLNDRDPRLGTISMNCICQRARKTLVRKNTEKIAGWEFR